MSREREEMSRMILGYLRKHPDAGDTLKGIATWLLEMGSIESSVDEVADVVNRLIEEGSIIAFKVKDGSTFYRISPGRL